MWRGGDSHNAEILPDTDRIRYVETDLAFLEGKPVHFICGIYLVCESGRCEVSTGAENFSLCAETELIFLAGTLLHRLESSDDFKARMILFPKDVFLKAMLPIDTPYLNYADEHPCYLHTSDERSRLTWRQACVWMDSAGMLFSRDYTSQYRELLEFDWLQSFLIWLFGTIPEKQESQSSSTRQQQICRSFMQLVREYAAQEHGAAFYAGKLCILNEKHLVEEPLPCHVLDSSILLFRDCRRTGGHLRNIRIVIHSLLEIGIIHTFSVYFPHFIFRRHKRKCRFQCCRINYERQQGNGNKYGDKDTQLNANFFNNRHVLNIFSFLIFWPNLRLRR